MIIITKIFFLALSHQQDTILYSPPVNPLDIPSK
jgi:hypothetical protein